MGVIPDFILTAVAVVASSYVHIETSGRSQHFLPDELFVWLAGNLLNHLTQKQISEI